MTIITFYLTIDYHICCLFSKYIILAEYYVVHFGQSLFLLTVAAYSVYILFARWRLCSFLSFPIR